MPSEWPTDVELDRTVAAANASSRTDRNVPGKHPVYAGARIACGRTMLENCRITR